MDYHRVSEVVYYTFKQSLPPRSSRARRKAETLQQPPSPVSTLRLDFRAAFTLTCLPHRRCPPHSLSLAFSPRSATFRGSPSESARVRVRAAVGGRKYVVYRAAATAPDAMGPRGTTLTRDGVAHSCPSQAGDASLHQTGLASHCGNAVLQLTIDRRTALVFSTERCHIRVRLLGCQPFH